LAWRIEFEQRAEKELAGLDKQVAARIVRFLREKIAPLEDPRTLGEPLHGPEIGRLWKYRVGDYRLICQIRDFVVTIAVIRIGHRREIYRR
jgi:mRNA interferase RelE/StbE